jgi:hypothetical protein
MGKKVNKETTISKSKVNKKEEPTVKESPKVTKKEEPKPKLETKNDKKKRKNFKEEKLQENLEIKDEKIMNDAEEAATFDDINKKYELVLNEVREKLTKKLDESLIARAIKCLKKIVLDKYKDSLNLLSNDQEEFLYLNFVLGKLPFKFSIRPASIHVPQSLYGKKFNTQICLIVKDPRSDFKDLNIHKDLPFKLKVIDIEKLKLKFSRFNERRNLLKEYEMFLCDHKIYNMLKKHLGKPFYASKKYPYPIRMDYTKPSEIKDTICSIVTKTTPFYMTHGPNYSVKISRAVSSNEEILENIKEGAGQTLSNILKWGVNFDE